MRVLRRSSIANRATESNGQHGSHSLAALTLIAALAVAMPISILLEVADSGRSSAWLGTMAIILWGGIRLSVSMTKGRPRLFDLFFWIFTYIFLGVAATVQIRTGMIASTTPYIDPAMDVPTVSAIWVGIACYEWAYGLSRLRNGNRTRIIAPPARSLVTSVDTGRAHFLTLFGILIGTIFILRVGVVTLLTSREAVAAVMFQLWPDKATLGIVMAIATFPLLVGLGGLSQRERGSSPRRWSKTSILGWIVLLLLVNPISTARYVFGTALFAAAVLVGSVRSAWRTRWTMAGTLASFLFLFPIADAFRYSSRTQGVSPHNGFFSEYAGNGDYDAFWQIANALMYWGSGMRVPLRQALGVLLFWVPRAIWHDKPVDTGILLAEYRGYDFTNLSAPLWAEGLVNGGVIGMGMVFVAFGVLLSALDNRLVSNLGQLGWWTVCGGIFPAYLTIILRGSLLQATGFLVVTILCVRFLRPARPSKDSLFLPASWIEHPEARAGPEPRVWSKNAIPRRTRPRDIHRFRRV